MKKTQRETHTFTDAQAESLRDHVKDQLKTYTQAALDFAKALFEVRYGTTADGVPLVEAWKFESFEEYAEKELLIHGGTARSYVRTYDELCVRRSFDEGVLPPSITALRELAKVSRKLTDQRELHQWIKRAHQIDRLRVPRRGRGVLVRQGPPDASRGLSHALVAGHALHEDAPRRARADGLEDQRRGDGADPQ